MQDRLLAFLTRFSKFLILSLSLVPLFFVVINSVRSAGPLPLQEILSFHGWSMTCSFSLSSYAKLLSNKVYLGSFITSTLLAATCLLFTLPFAFLIAVSISKLPEEWQDFPTVLVTIPIFIPFVVKLYSWIYISEEYLGWCPRPLAARLTVWLFCCYSNLPMAVNLILSDLRKIDRDISHAASDLGAGPASVLLRILLPLSTNSIQGASLLTAINSFGEFVVPELLGCGTVYTVGSAINAECLFFHDLPVSSAISVLMICWSLFPIFVGRYLFLRNMI